MYVVEKRIVFEWEEVKEVQEIFLEVKEKLEKIADGELSPEAYIRRCLSSKYAIKKIMGFDEGKWVLFGFRVLVERFGYDSTVWIDTHMSRIEGYHHHKYELRLDETQKDTKKAYEGLKIIHNWLKEILE